MSRAAEAVRLSPDDARLWREAIEQREDAVRKAETVVLRAKLSVADALDAQITMVRAMAQKYAFDARRTWTLHDDDHLTISHD